MGVPPLARGGFDRAAHRRADAEWLAAEWPRAHVVVVHDGRVLVHGDPPRLVLRSGGEPARTEPEPADRASVPGEPADGASPPDERYFLGVDPDGRAYFAVPGELAPDPAAGIRLATLRDVGHLLTESESGLFLTAVALVNWHARHRYSPATGLATTVGEGGWTRTTATGETLFPRTDPAVIVLVHDGGSGPDGRCLLGHNASWPAAARKRYSCLAGFVEPGESAEATVVREVGEEVGVTVTASRYVASQAWPFPGSLMLGFTAIADPAEPVRVDETEIADARWFSRVQIAAALAGERVDFALPPRASIANYLIERWLAGQGPAS